MSTNSHNYRFGSFELRTGEHRLLRNGTFIPLPRKTYEVLLTLVTSKGDVVSKDEFFRRIWPQTFIEDGSLTVNISLLRKILANGSDKATYIQTIPRVGYRFAAKVTEPRPLRIAHRLVLTRLNTQKRRIWIGILCIGVFASSGLLGWQVTHQKQPLQTQVTAAPEREALSEILVLSEMERLVRDMHLQMATLLTTHSDAEEWSRRTSRTFLTSEINRFAALPVSKEAEGINLINKVEEYVQTTRTEASYTRQGEMKFSSAIEAIMQLKNKIRDKARDTVARRSDDSR